MTLVPTRLLMEQAAARGVGQGAFNVLHLETAEGLVSGAEKAGLPVILQISQNCVTYHGCLEPVALATLSVARRASVPVAVHLDHAEDEALVMEAVELGFGSVMFDGARLPYSRTSRRPHGSPVRRTSAACTRGGARRDRRQGRRPRARGATDPGDAVRFVEETGVDALAVAVGSSHAMTERTASLDLELVAALHRSLEVPLVLHGSSGVPDEQIVAAIAAGMRKINVSTHLNRLFTGGVRRALEHDPALVDSRGRSLRAGRAELGPEVARMLSLFAGAGPRPQGPGSGLGAHDRGGVSSVVVPAQRALSRRSRAWLQQGQNHADSAERRGEPVIGDQRKRRGHDGRKRAGHRHHQGRLAPADGHQQEERGDGVEQLGPARENWCLPR